MRFGKDQVHQHEAPALKAALAKHGIDLFVAAPKRGEDISRVVFEALALSDFFIAFATPTYAEDTGNPACTYNELQYWRTTVQPKAKKKGVTKPIIPIRMLNEGEEFETSRPGVLLAEVLFGSNLSYVEWPLGSTRNADGTTTVPESLVKDVVDAAAPPPPIRNRGTGFSLSVSASLRFSVFRQK